MYIILVPHVWHKTKKQESSTLFVEIPLSYFIVSGQHRSFYTQYLPLLTTAVHIC